MPYPELEELYNTYRTDLYRSAALTSAPTTC